MRSDHFIRNADWTAPQDRLAPKAAMMACQLLAIGAFFSIFAIGILFFR